MCRFVKHSRYLVGTQLFAYGACVQSFCTVLYYAVEKSRNMYLPSYLFKWWGRLKEILLTDLWQSFCKTHAGGNNVVTEISVQETPQNEDRHLTTGIHLVLLCICPTPQILPPHLTFTSIVYKLVYQQKQSRLSWHQRSCSQNWPLGYLVIYCHLSVWYYNPAEKLL